LTGNRRSLPLALLVLLPVLLATGCGAASHPAAAAPRRDLESIFEDEGHLHADPAGTVARLARLGVDRVRVYVRWNLVSPAPTSPRAPAGFAAADSAAYPPGTWALYDAVVRAAAHHGVGVDLTLGGPGPAWATSPGAPRGAPAGVWRPSATAYGEFVRAVATRYSGSYAPPGAAGPLPRVNFWAIWNEPNFGPELAPQAVARSTVEVSPQLYRGLLDAAWKALGATGHGGDTILIGETAPAGQTVGDVPGNFGYMVPLRFIRALYCVSSGDQLLSGSEATRRGCPAGSAGAQRFAQDHPALFNASGIADHPYPQGGTPPDQVTPDEPDYADLAALGRLEATLDRARAAYGTYPKLPIYNTEFGYQTNPPETIAHTTTPALAARYLNWAEYISWRDPRVRSYDQFLLSDPPNANASGGFATGLEFKDGTPKATYDAFRLPVFLPPAPQGSGTVEVWGCVRPAHQATLQTGAAQRVRIQYRAGATGRFRTLSQVAITDPHGYFDVRIALGRSGEVRLAWSYPRGATIHSRVARLGVG
jgi:hypothetical protein